MVTRSSTGYILNGKYVRATPGAEVKQHREHQGHRDHVRMTMAKDYSRDLVQPWIGDKPNPAFVEAHPDKAQMYFGEERVKEIRKEL